MERMVFILREKKQEPTKAKLLLGRNEMYPIEAIHYKTKQITLREKENIYNTVALKNVVFDFSSMSEEEIRYFMNLFNIN